MKAGVGAASAHRGEIVRETPGSRIRSRLNRYLNAAMDKSIRTLFMGPCGSTAMNTLGGSGTPSPLPHRGLGWREGGFYEKDVFSRVKKRARKIIPSSQPALPHPEPPPVPSSSAPPP